MTWSFGPLVLLVCLVILVACFAVKLLFKRGHGSGRSGRSTEERGIRRGAGFGARWGGHCAQPGDDAG